MWNCIQAVSGTPADSVSMTESMFGSVSGTEARNVSASLSILDCIQIVSETVCIHFRKHTSLHNRQKQLNEAPCLFCITNDKNEDKFIYSLAYVLKWTKAFSFHKYCHNTTANNNNKFNH